MYKFYLFLLFFLMFSSGSYLSISNLLKQQFVNEINTTRENVSHIENKWKNLDKKKIADEIYKILSNLHPYNAKR